MKNISVSRWMPVRGADRLAFERIRATAPHIVLTESDGIHPTRAGTYLAACVFHATFFERSPEGNPYDARLSTLTAETLQAAAWITVRDYNGW